MPGTDSNGLTAKWARLTRCVAAILVAGLSAAGCGSPPAPTATASTPMASATEVPAATPPESAPVPATPAPPAKVVTAPTSLRIVSRIALGGEGRWDLLTVDPTAHRLYIARSTRIMVFDTEKDADVGEVSPVDGAHGIALNPAENQGYATAGKDNSVLVFDLKTLAKIQSLPTGAKPDAILFDSGTKQVFAFNHGDGTVTTFFPAADVKKTGKLDIGGALELGVSDGQGRVFVNVEDENEVVAIDAKHQKPPAHWKLTPGEEPTGLAYDPARNRLFAACGNAKMVVVDAANGKVVSDLPVGNGVDGLAFDPGLQQILVPNGKDGTLTVIFQGPDGVCKVTQTIETVKGARTIAVDEKTHRIYLPCNLPAANGAAAQFGLLILAPEEN